MSRPEHRYAYMQEGILRRRFGSATNHRWSNLAGVNTARSTALQSDYKETNIQRPVFAEFGILGYEDGLVLESYSRNLSVLQMGNQHKQNKHDDG